MFSTARLFFTFPNYIKISKLLENLVCKILDGTCQIPNDDVFHLNT